MEQPLRDPPPDSSEAREPRSRCSVDQELTAVRYELAVRLVQSRAPRTMLLIRCYETGQVTVALRPERKE